MVQVCGLFVATMTSVCAPVSGEAAASKSQLKIVASFYPMYIATLNIVRDVPGVSLSSMAPPVSGCLHDYQLRPSEVAAISRADVFVVNGAGMESFLEKAMQQNPRVALVVASGGMDLLINGGETNAHLWASPSLYIRQVRNIADGLSKADPLHAEQYGTNAEEYCAQVEDLLKNMQAGLKDIKRRNIVTFHEAFAYMANEFGLNVVAVIAREPGNEPDARELADTIAVVRKTGATTIFTEPQYSDKAAATIARETGAKLHQLDPAVTGPMQPDAYLRIMEKNLKVLREALK